MSEKKITQKSHESQPNVDNAIECDECNAYINEKKLRT